MPAWIDIDLDTIRKLRYRHNDIADLEERTGKGLGPLLQDTQFHGIRVLLAYGLRWMDPKITPQRAGDLIQEHWIDKGHTLNELSDLVQEALEAGGIMPKTAKTEKPEGNAKPEALTSQATSGST